jgi:hypothetical protein
MLAKQGLEGSTGRRGNPYDNPKAESFMKTLKVEAVYLMAYDSFEDVVADLPASSIRSTTPAGCIPRSDISAPHNSRITTPGRRSNPQPDPVHPKGRSPPGRAFMRADCFMTGKLRGFERWGTQLKEQIAGSSQAAGPWGFASAALIGSRNLTKRVGRAA